MNADAELIVETNQSSDLFQRWPIGASITARLLFQRCQEARTHHLPCQDYARVIRNEEGSSLCFCVCDGVGSSYQGGFAARYLATRLVDWLQSLDKLPQETAAFSASLQGQLDLWTPASQIELSQQELPAGTPTLVREVLQELRDTYGSETVFFCGRIDAAKDAATPDAAPDANAVFTWMGNVSARLAGDADQSFHLGDQGNDGNRWSTLRGCRGAPTTRVFTLAQLSRLIVHTDGADAIASELADLNDEALQQRTQELLALPTNDDITVLDIQWASSPSPDITFGKALLP